MNAAAPAKRALKEEATSSTDALNSFANWKYPGAAIKNSVSPIPVVNALYRVVEKGADERT